MGKDNSRNDFKRHNRGIDPAGKANQKIVVKIGQHSPPQLHESR